MAKILVLVGCVAVGMICLAVGMAADKTYEIQADRVVDAYYGDMGRMVGAYERLSEQYLTLVQNQLNRMSDDVNQGGQRLESIEKKLDALSMRLGRIEKALKIADETRPAPKPAESQASRPVGAESYPAEKIRN
jgi:hypothetical protein